MGMAGVAVDSVEDMKVGICLVFQLALCTYVQRNFMLQCLTEHLFLAARDFHCIDYICVDHTT